MAAAMMRTLFVDTPEEAIKEMTYHKATQKDLRLKEFKQNDVTKFTTPGGEVITIRRRPARNRPGARPTSKEK